MVDGQQLFLGPTQSRVVVIILAFEAEAGATANATGLAVDTVDAMTRGKARKPFVKPEKVVKKRPDLVWSSFFQRSGNLGLPFFF